MFWSIAFAVVGVWSLINALQAAWDHERGWASFSAFIAAACLVQVW